MDYFSAKEPRELKERLSIATAFVLSVFFILCARFWYLQVMEGDRFKELSQNNRVRLLRIPSPRGIIFDRNGIRLAENRPGFDLSVVPEDVDDWEKIKSTLIELVDIDLETIERRLKKAKRRPPFQAIKLKEDLSWEEMVRIEGMKYRLPGVVLEVGPKRAYPFGEVTAHLVGYLGEINEREFKTFRNRGDIYKPGDLVGKYGIERSFEEILRGMDGGKQVEVDALGRELRIIKKNPPTPGSNIHLTIDMKTQISAWKAMKGRAGAVVAMDPNTGRILAMVSTPSFDPNRLTSGISREEWDEIINNPMNVLTNRAIQGQYPPASLFKIITATSALEERVIQPYTTIYSGSSFRFGGREYRDWKEGGHGLIGVHTAIVESADTFFYQVGLMVGIDRIARYARWFGLGEKTGIELPNEKPGLVPTSTWKEKTHGVPWYLGETISVSVGQGFLLATPLQMLVAYSAIANGGWLMKPQLVEKIVAHDGRVGRDFTPVNRGRILVSSQTINILRRALEGVVNEENGTARTIRMDGLEIAGKTGTAQVVRMSKRERDIEKIPYRFRDHAWFVGYAPFDDPRIAVAVVVEHGGFGSKAAAPVALQVIKTYLEGLEKKESTLVESKNPGEVLEKDA